MLDKHSDTQQHCSGNDYCNLFWSALPKLHWSLGPPVGMFMMMIMMVFMSMMVLMMFMMFMVVLCVPAKRTFFCNVMFM